ncbi:M50 family metallopeptidase [Nocardioides bruguierae]|uniref:M50 family metallopeptidase n=1 Tax=Nocardioides bruguierae TaxID=2945102 RepID=A0A9X2D6R7_9ACTN|nr:M50 family metallopeptidase [Nocardioides bruguierae]MCM0619877.1 M50 family metallopeptidase [Nocardioides bruguierae]
MTGDGLASGVGDVLARVWSDVLGRQPLPEAWVVLATGAVALLLVAAPQTWHGVRTGVTVVHETGHALVAVLVGRRLSGIRLHSDTSGVTLSRGRPSGPGMVAMLAAGYLAPALLGVGAALLLAAGRPLALLWGLVLMALLLLVWVRNAYGVLVLVLLGGAVAALTWLGSPPWPSLAAYLVTWLLLLAAPRPLVELLGRGPAGRRGSDPDQLGRLTWLPALGWVWLMLLANLAGVVVGALTLAPQLLER